MINLLLFNFLTSIYIYSFGVFFTKTFMNEEKIKQRNFYDYGIYGAIFLSFIGLLLNFFLPLNKSLCTILLLIGLFYTFYNKNIFYLKKNYLYILSPFILSSLLLIFSNANRPDAGLYHLPFISIINENPIIIGLANIHFRFGHSSLIQYLSGINNNFLFDDVGITIPLSLLVSYLILYFYEEIRNLIKTKIFNYETLYLFFSLIFILYSFNRYSAFGNDAVPHIVFIYLIYKFIIIKNFKETNQNQLLEIILISIFLITQKIFLIIAGIFTLIIFFYYKDKRKFFLSRGFYFSSLFIIIFFLKNLLISGCLIYPMKSTCFNNLEWHDSSKTKTESISGEAWAKDWINFNNKNEINIEDYNKKFNWVKTWKKNHFFKVIEKFSPFVIFMILFTCYLFYLKKRYKKKYSYNKNILEKNYLICLLISLCGFLLWFLKFPLYRYGMSFIATTSILSLIYIINIINLDLRLLSKTLSNWILIGFVLFGLRNINRIIETENKNYLGSPWPKIYSFTSNNEKQAYDRHIKGDKFMFYTVNNGLCMYGPSPCTYYIDNKLKKKKF